MAISQTPFSAKQNLSDIARFMMVALMAGFVAHQLIPADASRNFTFLVMFLVGVGAGVLNKLIEYRFPSSPSMPSAPAAFGD